MSSERFSSNNRKNGPHMGSSGQTAGSCAGALDPLQPDWPESQIVSKSRLAPRQTWAGLTLIAVFWPLNWILPGNPTAYLFFPLWLGYILTVDGVVFARTGDSLLNRSGLRFVGFFVVSAPAWWLFEAINWRTRNWEYVGAGTFTALEYHLLCTLSFSTVIPAVFETAELARSFRWVANLRKADRFYLRKGGSIGFIVIGLGSLALTLGWPTQFYPLVWGAIYLLIEGLNLLLGRRTLVAFVCQGDWRPIVALSLGALICGFFWEMWNYFAFPKWIYHTPGAQFLHLFEMPILGYLGYLPFAWELFALNALLWPKSPPVKI